MNNKNIMVIGTIVLLLLGGFYFFKPQQNTTSQDNQAMMTDPSYALSGQNHASMVLTIGETVFYVDPVGGAERYDEEPQADVVLITDIHGDHFDVETLTGLEGDLEIIVPQVVADALPESMQDSLFVLENGQQQEFEGFIVEAIPMYNLPESDDAYHVKGRGNGYLISYGEKRFYIAGDTEDTPEMRQLTDIDVAFVPMNVPYTMTIEQAASAVIEFAPKKVYPYHYRIPDGFSDVVEFQRLVDDAGKDIEVLLDDWYPEGSLN